MASRKTVGEVMVDLLEAYGVDTVFGIPGVHTVELYRGLATSNIRHITPRNEQSAGFMADGYARVSGKPGVCLLITGPGLTNAITAMGQARADSIPMLIISGVNKAVDRNAETGRLHELPDQIAMMQTIALSTETVERGADLEGALDRAFAAMTAARPGPVHIEIPLDVMSEVIDIPNLDPRSVPAIEGPSKADIETAARVCIAARKPVLLIGGGAIEADVETLAERLDAPVVTTVNARGVMAGHPLLVPASPSLSSTRTLLADADLVIAAGTQFGPTDFDMYVDGGFPTLQKILRIDVDPRQAAKGQIADHVIIADAAAAIEEITSSLGDHTNRAGGEARAQEARSLALAELPAFYQKGVSILKAIGDALPNCLIVGDSTQLVYAGNCYCEVGRPRGWFNSATGFGSLGYGAPAAIGAQLAAPDTPVVCITGDGGFQFCMAEIGTAMDENTPVIFIVWNNDGYQEIENFMVENAIKPVGVKPSAPDFVAVAGAYGMAAEQITGAQQLGAVLEKAARTKGPYLIEILTD